MTAVTRKLVEKHSPVRKAQRAVLIQLAFAAVEDTGEGALRSVRQLERATNYTRRTVQRALAALERDDRIRRHRGGRSHCDVCARSRRGVVVYDVVLPAVEPAAPDGQMTLFAGASTGVTTGVNDQRHVTPVASDDQRHSDAGSGVTVTPLKRLKKTEGQQQRQDAREPSNDVEATVERVVQQLTPTRLFVDRYAIEGVVMRFASADIDQAVTEVVALASDPGYRIPKGGAAMMLLHQLRRQSSKPSPVRELPRTAPRELPDQFRKYDVAVGLAG